MNSTARKATQVGNPMNEVKLGGLRLPAVAASARSAREMVALVTRAWGLTEIADSARLAVSELVTNALLHTDASPADCVKLVFIRRGQLFRMEVHDASPKAPRPRFPADDAESGRGLLLIGEMADDHGFHLTPYGKAVWCEFKTDWPADPPA